METYGQKAYFLRLWVVFLMGAFFLLGGCSEESGVAPEAERPSFSGAESPSGGWDIVMDRGDFFAAAALDESRANAHTRPGVAIFCDGSSESGKTGEARWRMDIVLAEWPQTPRPASFTFQLRIDGEAFGKKEEKYLGSGFYGNPIYSFEGLRALSLLERMSASSSEVIRIGNGHAFFEIARLDGAMLARLRDKMERCAGRG